MGINGFRTPGLIVNSRWFALADLGLAAISGALWFFRPELAWLPLLLALIPWTIRTVAGLSPFQPTALDLFVGLVLLTAAVGVWAAYDRPLAWNKFWLLVGASLLFYALAGQPRRNLWPTAVFLSLIGVGIAAYFLLTHDWQAQPAKIGLLNRLAVSWMGIRPALSGEPLHPNTAAGIMALFAPLLPAIGLHGWRDRARQDAPAEILYALVGGVVLLSALLLTTSRGAWLALAGALSVWLLSAASKTAGKVIGLSGRRFFLGALALVGLLVVVFVVAYPGGPAGLANQLPGPAVGGSRVDLYRAGLNLIADFPVFGAGLAAFPGLYSQYIQVKPVFTLPHSHNLYLDLALEQGWLGLLAWLSLFGGALWLLRAPPPGRRPRRRVRRQYTELLAWGTAAGLLALLLHGFVDDPVYGTRTALFLLSLPGFAVAVQRSREDPEAAPEEQVHRSGRSLATLGGLILLLITAAWLILNRPLRAAWQVNLGSIEMARVELADWPLNEWTNGQEAAAMTGAAARFEQALAFSPENRSAHFRLGLVAMLQRNYEAAAGHLAAAQADGRDHRGVQKNLGYTYVWLAQYDQALMTLRPIVEAKQEMNVYSWWWQTQGRADLAQRAATMENRLAVKGNQ